MRLANANGRAVIVTDSGQLDLEAASGGRFGGPPHEVFRRWPDFAAWSAESTVDGVEPAPVDPAGFGPVNPYPRQIFAVGLNYVEHGRETGLVPPSQPMIFTKFATCLTGPHGVVRLPASTVDWEIELVVIIGREAVCVPESEAWSYVAAVTVGQDLSERTMQMVGSPAQFSLAKSYPGFGPIGPYAVTPDELDDRDSLTLTTRLNGELVQSGTTKDMIFSVPELIARLSTVCPLLPGDLIFTGTPPGVGMGRTPPRYLVDGDVLESSISGVGTMTHRFTGPVT